MNRRQYSLDRMRVSALVIVLLALCAAALAGRSKGAEGFNKLLKEGRAARNNQDMQVRLPPVVTVKELRS